MPGISNTDISNNFVSKALGEPLPTLVVGIGGFGRAHHMTLQELECEGMVRVIGTCDPKVEQLQDVVRDLDFQDRGIEVYQTFEEMMVRHAKHARLVTIAAPIHLHARMHERCVKSKIACYLEKPPTLDPREMSSMMEIEVEAEYATHVGFNFTIEEQRRRLKQRILSGEFGNLKRVGYLGLLARSSDYYTRNDWAAKLMIDDYLLLDSCFGNATSHFLHNMLHWAGTNNLEDLARPLEGKAQLYRVYPIEGADTVFASVKTDRNVELRLAISHAARSVPSTEYLELELATIEVIVGRHVCIKYKDGRVEQEPWEKGRLLYANLSQYIRYVQGYAACPIVSLANTLPFVELNALLYLASPAIFDISAENFEETQVSKSPDYHRFIKQIEDIARIFIQCGSFPDDQGVNWAHGSGFASRTDFPSLPLKIQSWQQGRIR